MMKSNKQFALFGHGIHLCYMAKELINRGFKKPVIITHLKDRHYRDKVLMDDKALHEDIFEVAIELDLKLIDVDKVNSNTVLDFLKENMCDIGFSLSCRSVIKDPIIDFFKGRLFNIHPSFLPKERGSGTFSWRILNDSKEISGTIHYIDKGIDTGNILLQEKIFLMNETPYPYDYLVSTTKLYKKLIDNFLCNIEVIINQPGVKQSEFEGSYFPRLITEINGAIDWAIDGKLIERTIRAFSSPYPGAFTYINGIKVSILKSKFKKNNHEMHPITYGKVICFTRKNDVKVVVKNGFIYFDKVKIISSNELVKIVDFFDHPIQFHTPYEEIDLSKYQKKSVHTL